MRCMLVVILCCAGLSAAAQSPTSQGPEAEELAGYEKLLAQSNVAVDGPGLLGFFRERTLSPEQIAQLGLKVQQLASPLYGERVKAAAELVRAGGLAKPLLVALTKDPKADLEAVRRAELCLRQIASGSDANLAAAAAYLLAKRQPAQAAEVLLAYVPFATEEHVLDAVQFALNKLAGADAKASAEDSPFVKALKDPAPVKRGAAGEALVRGQGQKVKDLVEHLLGDETPQVRAQVSAALVEARDKGAMPILIQTLAALPRDEAWPVEDLLLRLAGETAPGVYLDGKTAPAKVVAAWNTWWAKHEATVDLATLVEAPQMQGYTLITQMVAGPGLNGRVLELKPDKSLHWKFEGVRYPVDAQVVGKNRVLVAEYYNSRVTERDFQGKILWEKQISMPLGVQRLPNGHTFIATRRQLLIVDRAGKEVFTYFAPNISIAAAHWLRDGKIVFVTAAAQLKIIDLSGKEVASFACGQLYTMGANIDPLPGGRFLVPLYRENRVVEYDRNGQVKWQAQVQYPTSAVRLPNGNTLVVSLTGQRVIEINRDGKEVWSHQCDGRPWRARRR